MSTLEEIRSAHEELELYHQVLLHELSRHPRSKRQIIFQDHKLRNVAQQARKRAKTLVNLHADKHGLLASECAELQDKSRRFTRFYRELNSINSYHANRNAESLAASRVGGVDKGTQGPDPFSELDIPASGSELVDFSGEEYHGRFLDMHALFYRCKNLPGAVTDMRYEDFVSSGFFDFSLFPATTKRQRRYREYVSDLLQYLEGFLQRTRPLMDHSVWTLQHENEFNVAWHEDRVEGWKGGAPDIENVNKEAESENSSMSDVASNVSLTVSKCENVHQLEKLGLERLKTELMNRGVKCGGTLTDRAERLFLVRNLSNEEIPAKLRAKKNRKKRSRGGANTIVDGSQTNGSMRKGDDKSLKTVALKEWLICLRAKLSLSLEINDTVRQLHRKHTRTHEEMRREMEDEVRRDDEDAESNRKSKSQANGQSDEEEDEVEMMYNPKGLPLGWDGKPIPYWLYRLHGLSKSFKCEICGNHTYWGHRDFDNHFQEARHVHGMKCLKIPNTNHFHGVTKISDALQLYAKLKEKLSRNAWNTNEDEEFEDSAGNILSKATYLDLQKQGLL